MFLGAPALEPVRLSGHEGINGLFEYELLLKTPDALNLGASGVADLDLDSLIGREISCVIELDGTGQFVPGGVGAATDHVGSGTRQINAFISKAAMLGEEGRHIQYRLTLSPWLYLATKTTNVKIFQNMTVVDILDELLGGYPFPVEKRLIETYAPRDYQTQFNESDYDFFLRLTQENGMSFFFSHSEDKHRLVLIDNMGAYQQNASAAYQQIEYHPPGWKTDAEYIHRFVPQHQLTSGKFSARDYDYSRPRADLSVSRADPRPTGQAEQEVYQWHDGMAGSHYAQPRAGSATANDPQAEGRNFALLRMQALRTEGARAEASGNLRGMVPGCFFSLQKHPRQKANADYLILQTHFVIEDVAQDSQVKDAAAHRTQRWKVEVDFMAHPMREMLRPAITQAKPYSHGPQTALVVGPPGENLWTDDLGRIKVQFMWDRLGEKNQHSSCWVRVASQWAGNQLGAMHMPRIGEEVIVDFLSGDPDLPICTGKVYNQNNLPPWRLPLQAALSGFRSRELTKEGGNSAAGRSNHLILDDTDQKIQAQLKSDHQHSQISLGHITRIEDNGGRKEERGQGLEVRTDGHGAIRAASGLLLTTEARANAKAHITDMGETVARLSASREQHENLSAAAQDAKAHESGDQDEVAKAISSQNDALSGKGGQRGRFPELDEPHLVLASPAGIETTTSRSTHISSGEHTALTSGGHTSISAALSFLVSVKKAVRMFAFNGGMKFTAYIGDLDFSALKDNINMLAKKEIVLKADKIRIEATTEFSFVGGGSYGVYKSGSIETGTTGSDIRHAASHSLTQLKSLPVAAVQFPEPVCKECLRKAMAAASPFGGR